MKKNMRCLLAACMAVLCLSGCTRSADRQELKSILRKLKVRAFGKLSLAVAQAFRSVSAEDGRNWFSSCGLCIKKGCGFGSAALLCCRCAAQRLCSGSALILVGCASVTKIIASYTASGERQTR